MGFYEICLFNWVYDESRGRGEADDNDGVYWIVGPTNQKLKN